MKKLLFSVFCGIVAPMIGCLFQILIPWIIVACLFCNINSSETYGWYSGIWHGIFIPVNYIRWLFFDVNVIATSSTIMYKVFYWFFSGCYFLFFSKFLKRLIIDSITCYKKGPENINWGNKQMRI